MADVYDALTSQRSYRKAWQPKQALEYIISASSSQFDSDLVEKFSHLISIYPDSLVKLSDDSTAVVVKNHTEDIFRPCIRLLESSPLGDKGYEIDLFEDIRYQHLTVATVLGNSDDESFALPSGVISEPNEK